MLTRISIVLVCLMTVGLTDIAVAQPSRSRSRVVLPTQGLLSRYGLERGWWGQAVVDPDGDHVKHVTFDNALCYVQSRAGNITALDIQTGKRVWYTKFGIVGDHTTEIVSDDEFVYFISGTHLVALDRFTGHEEWMLRLPGAVSSQIVVDKTQIYFGDITGMFFAVDLPKIRDFARRGELPRSSFDTINWRYRAADDIRFTPILMKGNVVFVSNDGTLYSLAKDDKRQFLHFEGDSPVVAPLSAKEGNLFLAVSDRSFRRDQRIFCLEEATGQTVWQKVLTQPVIEQMMVVDDSLFVTPIRQGMLSLSPETGLERWRNIEAIKFLSLTKSFVLASDSFDNILMLDRNDGKLMGRIPLRAFTTRVSNDRSDRLYITTPDGIVACIHEEGAEFPIHYDTPEERLIAPEHANDAGASQEPMEDSPSANSGDTPVPQDENEEAEPSEKPEKKEKPASKPKQKKEPAKNDGFFDF